MCAQTIKYTNFDFFKMNEKLILKTVQSFNKSVEVEFLVSISNLSPETLKFQIKLLDRFQLVI